MTMVVSHLFARITTYSRALNYLKGENSFVKSFHEVIQYLDARKATVYRTTNLSLAAVNYIRHGFKDSNVSMHKIKIAMYVAVLQANFEGGDDLGLGKAVCERFRGVEDFDREAMTKIFHFSVCNDRVRLLLDNILISKTTKIHAAIEHEFRIEFILSFLVAIQNLVRRGQALTDLKYVENATRCQVESARAMVERHAPAIAAKFGSCFNVKSFKKARAQNNLFPARGGLPRVSIGCKPIDFDDRVTVEFLSGVSLAETSAKYGFLETMYAAMIHGYSEPGNTYRSLKLRSVQDFYLNTFLDGAQREEALDSIPETPKEGALREELINVRASYLHLSKKHLEMVKEITRCREIISDLKGQLRRERLFCKKFNLGTKCSTTKSFGGSVRMDKHYWLLGQRSDDDNNTGTRQQKKKKKKDWSGDEDE